MRASWDKVNFRKLTKIKSNSNDTFLITVHDGWVASHVIQFQLHADTRRERKMDRRTGWNDLWMLFRSWIIVTESRENKVLIWLLRTSWIISKAKLIFPRPKSFKKFWVHKFITYIILIYCLKLLISKINRLQKCEI